jgi:hypothetical protein
MLARFSMLFNIALAFSVYLLHAREESLRNAVIECHKMRYDDYKQIVQEQGYLKRRIENNAVQIQQARTKAEEAEEVATEIKQKTQSTE